MKQAKVVNYYNDRYCGKMPPEQCDILDSLIEADAQNGSVVDLTHIIYKLNDADVLQLIEDYEMFGRSLHEFQLHHGELHDYQTLAVCFMYYAQKCILGDSVGLGKTVASAGVCNLIKRERAKLGLEHRYLVLTQKNLAVQFRQEMVTFTGEFVDLIPSGEIANINRFRDNNPYTRPIEFNVVGTHALLSTDGFIQWLEQCRQFGNGFPFDTLIIDESSELGGKAQQLIRGYKYIAKYVRNIYFLNATPFESHLEIFYNQLNLLDPDLLPTKTNFTKEYCIMDYRGMYARPTGRYKNQGRFKHLIGYRYFARTRRDKGAVMQDCKGGIVLSKLSKVQKDLLNKSQSKRLIYDCPSYLDDSIEFNETNVPKLESIHKLLDNECVNADTIIMFVYFKEAQAQLSAWMTEQGYSNRVLNGDTSMEDRHRIISGFQNKEFRILLTNVQKGLNFGTCDYCIFYSFDPNPAHMIQFEGRITREFDIVGKSIYILCSMGLEYQSLIKTVKQRTQATTEFTNTDLSVVVDILLNGGVISNVSDE